ncbi:Bug family tripartite tricarboxylate transporter substrate binding protein [Sabulicella glaciei]|uniref:Tripartite tricarboxylate transporter substrate binding protein n=1 Tax=Sabulicella glaciei TaxID=2984948 RepID=A0ABT3NVQ8_9PROT|nr:tripartite tricarboxylate transporter substrate binding protein [Roseococcus sp. MDT2-1-1]MCW8086268.1 tripartite tricarboxylate transporter substrate binding protein [Roseococcus sp. MDT2-1-1]
MNRRAVVVTALGLAAVRGAAAQEPWPSRPIRLIVPYPPGGGTDVISREMASRLAALTGWTIVAENRPGAGGNVGIDAVAKATDGHTIGMGQTSNLAINPTLYGANIPYQPLRDLALVSLVASQPNVFVVARNSPYRSLADVTAAARARPGRLTAGHPGNGTVGHLSTEMIALAARVELTVVPYRGAAQLVTDLLAGRLDLYSANPLAVKGLLDSGELRPIAVTSAQRMRILPDVPTVAEAGFPGFDAVNWTGIVAPIGTPPSVLAQMNEAVVRALRQDELVARLAGEGSEPTPSTPEQFRSFLAAEIEKWGRVVQEARVRAD